MREGLKLDLLVDGHVVVELKAVEALHPVHSAQVLTYLRLTGFPAGLLMTFNVTGLRSGLRRLDHPPARMERDGVYQSESGPTNASRRQCGGEWCTSAARRLPSTHDGSSPALSSVFCLPRLATPEPLGEVRRLSRSNPAAAF